MIRPGLAPQLLPTARKVGHMRKSWNIEKGQRYVQRPKAEHRHGIWEVGSIQTGGLAIPHARLINVDDPMRSKTISCSALADPSYYELLRETGGAP